MKLKQPQNLDTHKFEHNSLKNLASLQAYSIASHTKILVSIFICPYDQGLEQRLPHKSVQIHHLPCSRKPKH